MAHDQDPNPQHLEFEFPEERAPGHRTVRVVMNRALVEHFLLGNREENEELAHIMLRPGVELPSLMFALSAGVAGGVELPIN